MMLGKTRRILAALAVVAAADVAVIGGTAGVAMAQCPTETWYSTSGAAAQNVDMMSPVYGGPGIHLSIALQSGSSFTSSFTASASFSVSDVISSAQATISSSIEYSRSTSVTITGTADVPSTWSRGGYLHAGAHSYHYNWARYFQEANCTTVIKQAYGTARSPYALGFWLTQA